MHNLHQKDFFTQNWAEYKLALFVVTLLFKNMRILKKENSLEMKYE
jgi:hypothetical protein